MHFLGLGNSFRGISWDTSKVCSASFFWSALLAATSQLLQHGELLPSLLLMTSWSNNFPRCQLSIATHSLRICLQVFCILGTMPDTRNTMKLIRGRKDRHLSSHAKNANFKWDKFCDSKRRCSKHLHVPNLPRKVWDVPVELCLSRVWAKMS